MVDEDRISGAFDGRGAFSALDGPGSGPSWVCADEYLASVRDIPDEVLDAAPDGMPEELWLAAMQAEAAGLPDPLDDPAGLVLAGALASVIDADAGDGEVIDRITGYDGGVRLSV